MNVPGVSKVIHSPDVTGSVPSVRRLPDRPERSRWIFVNYSPNRIDGGFSSNGKGDGSWQTLKPCVPGSSEYVKVL